MAGPRVTGTARIANCIALTAVLLQPSVAFAQSYSVIALGPGSVAVDINNRPQVAGFVRDEVSNYWAVIWDDSGMHALGVRADVTGGLRINDLGIVVGIRAATDGGRLFAWVGGTIIDVPSPPGDTPKVVRELTNTNVLLVRGLRSSWRFVNGVWTDLTAHTGAEIYALNTAGMLGGLAAGRPFLQFADGHTAVPWSTGTVSFVSAAGHFASAGQGAGTSPFWWYGTPDGSVTRVAETSVFANYVQTTGMNSSGDTVGYTEFQTSPFGSAYTIAWLYRDGTVHWLPMNTAAGLNDAGYIIGAGATSAIVLVPTSSPPTGLVFTVVNRIVTLSWQPVVGATDYIVEAGSTSGARDLYAAPIGASPSLVTQAPAGRYYVRVRAHLSTGGITDPSQEVIIDVP